MSEFHSLARRLFGFTGLPFLSLLTPLLLLPLLVRVGGAQVWAGFSIGQATGTFASILIAFGWTLVGPSRIAENEGEQWRKRLFASSVVSRLVLFSVAAPVAVIATTLLVDAEVLAISTLTSLAFAIGGLSPSWYCIGVGRPAFIARYELLPRVVATIIAAGLILLTDVTVVYPILLIASSVFGQIGFTRRLGGRSIFRGISIGQSLSYLWRQKSAAGASLASGAYSSAPVALVGVTGNYLAVALFASAEKLYRISLFTISALSNTFQGWVSEGGGRVRKMRIAITVHAVWGIAGCLALALAGPLASGILFGPNLTADQITCLWFGLSFAAVSLNTALARHVLIPLRRTGTIFISTLAGAAVGVPSVFLLSVEFGGAGGAMGLCFGESAVCLVQGTMITYLWLRRITPGEI